ncbi:MAG: hypothetical protein EXS11_06785 [Gemmataceae bacterium]|nr:hypothetical protein [Gemmataceae bacterium]
MSRFLSSLAILATIMGTLPLAWCCQLGAAPLSCCAKATPNCCSQKEPTAEQRADCFEIRNPSQGSQTNCFICQKGTEFFPRIEPWEPLQPGLVSGLSVEAFAPRDSLVQKGLAPVRRNGAPSLWLVFCCIRC